MKPSHPILAAAAAAWLAACVSSARHPATVAQDLSSIMGADISTAVGILGFPDARTQAQGRRVYVWSGYQAARLPETEIRMGTYAGKPPLGSKPARNECRVELSADDSGRIAGYEWSGTPERCGWVVEAFRRASEAEREK